jgi:predicted RNase H-like HicB family nuclease
MRYAVVIEKAGNNFGAYVPDLPGCIATGATMEEVEALIREAVEIHIEGMLEDNLPLPPSIAQTRYVEIESNARLVAAQP